MRLGAVEPRRVKDGGRELSQFRARAFVAFGLVTLCLLLLLGRFLQLQVLRYDEFRVRSDENRIKLRPLPPSRGLIYDRNGELLAENVPQYRLELVPEQVPAMDATLARLTTLMGLSEDELAHFAQERRFKRRFDSIPLKLQLSEAEVARFAVHRHEFPGVEVVPYLTRYYPRGDALTHVVGYVGRVDADDQQRLDASRRGWLTHIGKTGIERYYEDILVGEVGYEQVETDAQGRALRVLTAKRVPPRPGRHVYLSIDARLQRATVAAFGAQPGAAVAIDPRNGEVLALVSVPSFDANLFVNGISRRDYAALLDSPYKPLLNRALQGGFEPGSTVKPFVGLAGLELGLRTPESIAISTGSFRLPGMDQSWGDWKPGGHGRVDLHEALAQSVNTYFYELAVDLGIDRLGSYLAQFGFGAPTGIDLSGEASGVLPSRDWKRGRLDQPWFPGETVIAGIGQGYWVVTPLQLAHATATLAAEGTAHTPHLLLATQGGVNSERTPAVAANAAPSFVRDPNHVAVVRDAMVAVMHGPTGTARAAGAGAPYRIAGKSGTAQRINRRQGGETDPARVAEQLRHRAWFIAYAPAEAPEIAVAVLLEFGMSGSRAAAPLVREILDAYFAARGSATPQSLLTVEGDVR
jgi:penicillin-binding protein 2